MNTKAWIAEFIGTFALIFIGVGSVVAMGGFRNADLVMPALAHGLTIAVMASALGAVSGGHFNPAVSIAMLVTGRMKAADCAGYIVSQILGALAGSFLLKAVLPATELSLTNQGVPALGQGITPVQGIVIELVLTFFLVLVIFGTAVDKRAPKAGGLFIGLTVTLDILMGGPLTGGCMNPARYLGPALAGGGLSQIAVYLTGTIVGAVLAALVYQHLFLEEPKTEPAA